MAKFNHSAITQKICSLLEEDSYTIAELCENVGISSRCFYKWQRQNPLFARQVAEARGRYTEKVIVECKRSLLKMINGFFYEEVKVVNKPGDDGIHRIKEIVRWTKYMPPSVQAIIWTMCVLDPDNWKISSHREITGKGGKDLFPAKILTKKELEELGIPLVAHQSILDVQDEVLKGLKGK